MFKINNRSTGTKCEISSKLKIKTVTSFYSRVDRDL